MLKFFDKSSSCHIVIEQQITTNDIEMLEVLLQKNYTSWDIEFGIIFNVGVEILNLLYKEIFENHKQIFIFTHKDKLHRYFKRLGFNTKFESLLKKDIINIDTVEIILIGGSADSSTKIIEIIKNTTLDNLALVIVQHVKMDKSGIFDEILQRYTKHKVSYAKNGEKIKKSSIYIAPNNKHLKVKDGCFLLSDDDKYNFSKPSVSVSYLSFSSYYKDKLLAIQECGYASDGVDKLKFLKRNNSKLIIQDIDECEAKPMIQNALNLSVEDYVLNLKNIIIYLNLVDKKISKDDWIEYLLEMIYEKYSYDFRLYYRDMVNRRLGVFMINHRIKSIKDAIGVILFNSSAFKVFFLELSINVTELFRKPKSFQQMVQFLNMYYKKSHNIKLWSAGCSSGEEVYSTAIILDSLGLLDKSIIYATDFNNVILEEAKNGAFSNELYQLAKENFAKIGLNTNLDSYFIKNKNYLLIDEKIKKKTLFFEHNLTTDSSFNEFDIIICKNVIIYFDKDLQKKVFQLFYDSLKFGGHLVLGESESMIGFLANKFEQCSDDCKIFKKVA